MRQFRRPTKKESYAGLAIFIGFVVVTIVILGWKVWGWFEKKTTLTCTKTNEKKNEAGTECECDEGYSYNTAGLCIEDIDPEDSEEEEVVTCNEPNQEANNAGECVCKTGYAFAMGCDDDDYPIFDNATNKCSKSATCPANYTLNVGTNKCNSDNATCPAEFPMGPYFSNQVCYEDCPTASYREKSETDPTDEDFPSNLLKTCVQRYTKPSITKNPSNWWKKCKNQPCTQGQLDTLMANEGFVGLVCAAPDNVLGDGWSTNDLGGSLCFYDDYTRPPGWSAYGDYYIKQNSSVDNSESLQIEGTSDGDTIDAVDLGYGCV